MHCPPSSLFEFLLLTSLGDSSIDLALYPIPTVCKSPYMGCCQGTTISYLHVPSDTKFIGFLEAVSRSFTLGGLKLARYHDILLLHIHHLPLGKANELGWVKPFSNISEHFRNITLFQLFHGSPSYSDGFLFAWNIWNTFWPKPFLNSEIGGSE